MKMEAHKLPLSPLKKKTKTNIPNLGFTNQI